MFSHRTCKQMMPVICTNVNRDVIIWEPFQHCCLLVRRIHRTSVGSKSLVIQPLIFFNLFFLWLPEQVVEQTIELPVFWDTVTSTWRHCNVNDKTNPYDILRLTLHFLPFSLTECEQCWDAFTIIQWTPRLHIILTHWSRWLMAEVPRVNCPQTNVTVAYGW